MDFLGKGTILGHHSTFCDVNTDFLVCFLPIQQLTFCGAFLAESRLLFVLQPITSLLSLHQFSQCWESLSYDRLQMNYAVE